MLAKLTWCLLFGFVVGLLFPSPVAAQGQIKISGYVKDADGNSYSGAMVSVSGPLWKDETRAETRTNDQGYYELSLGEQKNYWIWVNPPKKKQAQNYTYMYELPIARQVERGGRTEIREDFGLERAGNIVLEGYLSNGDIARFQYLKSIREGNLYDIFYATDFKGIPSKLSVWSPVFDSYAIAQGWKPEFGIPSVMVAFNAPTVIHILWEVKGFGQVMLQADNEGKDYVTTPQKDLLILNLNYELARTKYRSLKNNLDAGLAAGYTFSENIKDRITQAKTYLDQAAQVTGAQQASLSDLSLNQSLWAGEQLELEKATQNIERYRKKDITLEFKDTKGNPIAGAPVSYDQTEHDFGFALMKEQDYNPTVAKLMRAAGFNLAWVQFYGRNSPARGKYDWGVFDRTGIEEYRKLGYKVAVEGLDAIEPDAHPPWWDNLSSFEELNAAIYEYVRAVAEHYKGVIDLWITSNEPHIKHIYRLYNFYVSREQAIQAIKTAIKGVREADPGSSIAVFMGFGIDGESLEKPEGDEITSHPRQFLELLNKEGVDYDSAELQFNYGGYTPGPDGSAWIILAARDLAAIAELFEQYGSLGKPVGVQMFNAPSQSYQGAQGYWHEPWNEKVQTEYVLDFYTIAFGNPHINKITYWSIMDYGNSVVGLLRRDGSPKPAYYALKDLITQKWTTHGQQVTDASGRITFRGFLGTYSIAVSGYQPQTITLTEAQPSTLTLQLEAVEKPAPVPTPKPTPSPPSPVPEVIPAPTPAPPPPSPVPEVTPAPTPVPPVPPVGGISCGRGPRSGASGLADLVLLLGVVLVSFGLTHFRRR